MTRTYRIWNKSENKNRIPFVHVGLKPYVSDKRKLSCICKRWMIRNRYTRMMRHRNKAICRKCGRLSRKLNVEQTDEYFNVRYKKAEYSEWFD